MKTVLKEIRSIGSVEVNHLCEVKHGCVVQPDIPAFGGIRVGLLISERVDLGLLRLLLIAEIRRLELVWWLPFTATGRLGQGVVALGVRLRIGITVTKIRKIPYP